MYSKEWGIGEIRVDISFINNTEWSERKKKEKKEKKKRRNDFISRIYFSDVIGVSN
jgi:hypothetical protein